MASGIRDILHSAIVALESAKTSAAVQALTLDHLIDQQIKVIEGGTGSTKLSRLKRLEILKTQMNATVDEVKKVGNDPDRLRALGIYEVDGTTGAVDLNTMFDEEMGP
jgi:hypothetical protein